MAERTFGKYVIKEELGRGAMGVVYEAHDPDRGLNVALKIMSVPPRASADTLQRQVERFYREARALSRLTHPHIAQFYDQGEINGRPFFSMERISGTNLRDRLQFQGPLSLSELTRLSQELLGALEHTHSRGVVHRDIKPENIMFMPDGSGKVMDFGIARVVADHDPSSAGGFQGSPAYMSPEQVAGRVVDGRSDLYSLGVTLYEAATNRRAFLGDSIAEITQRVVTEYPPPPQGLPPFFQAIIMKAIEKDPNYRYQRAAEMAEDVRLGRTPAVGFSPIPAPQAPVYTPPPPVYLGSQPPASPFPPIGPFAAPFAAPTAGSPPPAGVPPGAFCRIHSAARGVETCGSCGSPLCYTCLVEVPGRGVLCRSCAFGPRS